MANTMSGVNPAILRWAREKSGYTLEEVASSLNKSATDVHAWEIGESAPTYNQLEKLSYQLYKRPLAIFFFPSPPEEPDVTSEFRTLPDFEVEHLSPDTRYALRQAEAMQIALLEMSGIPSPDQKRIHLDLRATPNTSPVKLAKEVRKYLNITVPQQSSWKNTEEALKQWRDVVQDAGVYVFKRSFKDRGVSGFCVADDQYPVIYLNNSTPYSRQCFTLFHELGHLLLDQSGITKADDSYIDLLRGNNRKIEVIANHFAADILVPSTGFDAILDESNLRDEAIAEYLLDGSSQFPGMVSDASL